MAMSTARVLFIDDDADVRKTAELLLKKKGYDFFGASTPEEGLSRLVSDSVDVVLLDLNFARAQTSGEEGLSCLADILRHDPHTRVIMVTGYSGLNVAVRAVRAGARDVIMKPWNNERLIEAVEEAVASRRPASLPLIDPSIMIGVSESMIQVKATIDRYAPLTAPILLTGAAGTGKTLAGMALHRRSGRTQFVSRDASVVTPDDFQDLAETTLLIENIERLPEGLVPDLLGWLKAAPRQNSRLITTSSRGRNDLGLERGITYAISTLDLFLPPLAARPDDVVPLAAHFSRITSQQNGFPERGFDADAQALLTAQPWSDNIHALRYVVERSILLANGNVLGVADLVLDERADSAGGSPKASLADSEKTLIEDALKRHNFNVSAAAADLGLTRPALYRRMSKHGL